MADWSQYADSTVGTPDAGNDWSQYADTTPAPTAATDVSATEATGRGFANSASFGLGKWVNGIVGATLNRVDDPKTQGDVVSSITSSTPMTGGGFWADVTNSVEGQKAANAVAMSQHPVAYIAGAVAPAIVGGGALATGKAVLGALPTTVLGNAALGSGVGAASGAAESTTGKQLVSNTTTGAVVGGALSGLTSGVSTLVTKLGTSGATKLLDEAISNARSEDDSVSQAGLAKLRSLFGTEGGNPNERELMEAAERTRDAITKSVPVDKTVSTGQTGEVVKKLAPSAGDLGKDLVSTAVQATPGAMAGHLLSGGGFGSTAMGGLLTSIAGGSAKKMAGDISNFGAMRFAASPTAQAAGDISPLAVGNASGGVGPLNGQFGLSGMLGNYIDSIWAGK